MATTKYIVNNQAGQTINGEPVQRPYKVYTALLNGSFESAIVLENTLGEDITWTDGGSGVFNGTVTNPIFIENKVIGFAYSGGDANDGYLGMLVTRSNDNEITLLEPTGYSPNLFISVEIRVYN